MKRHFKKVIIQMASKHFKKCRDTQIKTVMGYTPILLKLKIKIVKFGKDVVRLELPYPAGGSSDIINIWENCFLLSRKPNKHLPFPQESHSDSCATDMLTHTHQKACVEVLMIILFIIAKNVKKITISDRMDKYIHIFFCHIIECYTTKRMNSY